MIEKEEINERKKIQKKRQQNGNDTEQKRSTKKGK